MVEIKTFSYSEVFEDEVLYKELSQIGYIEEEILAMEPCNCGGNPRHSDGGNYHQVVWIYPTREGKIVRFGDTREIFNMFEVDYHIVIWNGEVIGKITSKRDDRIRIYTEEEVEALLDELKKEGYKIYYRE
jgi:hypothetical protein